MIPETKVKRGNIQIKKKDLLGFLTVVKSVENNVDKIMATAESNLRGKLVAKEMNRLTYARHSFEHFQLDVPLKKLK